MKALPFLEDRLHPLLDVGDVLRRERTLDVEVVVEAVGDRRPDPELGVREEVLHGLRHDVSGRVPDDRPAFVGVGRDRLDDVAVLRVVREVLHAVGFGTNGHGALDAGHAERLAGGGSSGNDGGRSVDGQADLGHAAERTEVTIGGRGQFAAGEISPCSPAEVASVTGVEKKLPKGLAGAIDKALSRETMLAGAVLEEDAGQGSPSAVLVTPTRLLLVGMESDRSWPIDEVAVTDYQEGAPGYSAALAVLAGDQVLRLLVSRNHPHFDLQRVHQELAALDNPAMAAKVAELAWWDGRAAWPYGASDASPEAAPRWRPGLRGTLRLAQSGVHLHPAEASDPSLQLPWIDVTSIVVETPEELNGRLGSDRVAQLRLLEWGLETTGGECFVTVTTKQDELYYAAQAPPAQLREHWSGVLDQFTVDPNEAVAPAATHVVTTPISSASSNVLPPCAPGGH